MRAEVDMLFKNFSLKNTVGAPYLSDFLYARMLSLVFSGNSVGSVILRTKDGKFGINRSLGFSYLNKLFFPLFSTTKNFRGVRARSWKNVHASTFFWCTLLGLSFLSNNIRLHKLYKSIPGGLRTQIATTVPSNLNTPILFFLMSTISGKSTGSIPVTLRRSGLQFIGVELLSRLILESEAYFKNFRLAGQFFPVVFNAFTFGFSEKFFYPYYSIWNLGGDRSVFNLLFKAATARLLFVNRRPVEYLAGRNNLFQKRYRRFFSLLVDNRDIFVFYILLYVYRSKYDQLNFWNKFQKLSIRRDVGGSFTPLGFYELFETRLAVFGDTGILGEPSKDEYSFTYFFVNFLNYFTGWRSLMHLFLKFNGPSLYTVSFRSSRTAQMESCLLFLARFQCLINQNYWNFHNSFFGSMFKVLRLFETADSQTVTTYCLYNNSIRPYFLFVFFLKKIWFGFGKYSFNWLGFLSSGWWFCFYFIQRRYAAFNLITIKEWPRIYLNFFFENYYYLSSFGKKVYCLSLRWAVYLNFLFKTFRIFEFLKLGRILNFLVYSIWLAGCIFIAVWLTKVFGVYLVLAIMGYLGTGFSYQYLRAFNELAVFDKRFFYSLFFRTRFSVAPIYYFLKIEGIVLLCNLFQIGWRLLYKLITLIVGVIFANAYSWQQHYKLLLTGVEFRRVTELGAVYFMFPRFSILGFFYFGRPSFLLSIQFKMLNFFWVGASLGKVNWLLRMLVKMLFSELGWWLSSYNYRLYLTDFIRIFFINRLLINTSSYNYANRVTWFRLLSFFDSFLNVLLELLFVRGVLTYSRYLYFYKKFGFKFGGLTNLRKVWVIVGDVLLDGHIINVFGERGPKQKVFFMPFYGYYLNFNAWSLGIFISLIVVLLSGVIGLLLCNFLVGWVRRAFYIFRFFYLLGK